MSKVIKYYYSKPIMIGTIVINPILNKTVIYDVRQDKRYTFAVVFNDKEHTIKFGYATCLPIDNFCKATGQYIAKNNAINFPFYIINNFNGKRNDYANDVSKIIEEIEFKLTKHNNPKLFNSKYFIN